LNFVLCCVRWHHNPTHILPTNKEKTQGAARNIYFDFYHYYSILYIIHSLLSIDSFFFFLFVFEPVLSTERRKSVRVWCVVFVAAQSSGVMDLLHQYGASDSSSDDESPTSSSKTPLVLAPPTEASLTAPNPASSAAVTAGISINSAPSVDGTLLVQQSRQERYVAPGANALFHNPTAQEMWKRVEGPAHPTRSIDSTSGHVMRPNAHSGYVQTAHVDDASFQEQFNTFAAKGYAADPSLYGHGIAAGYVGDVAAAQKNQGETVFTASNRKRRAKTAVAAATSTSTSTAAAATATAGTIIAETKTAGRAKRKKRALDPSNVNGYLGSWAAKKTTVLPEPTAEQKANDERIRAKRRKRGRTTGSDDEDDDATINIGADEQVVDDDAKVEEWETSEFYGDSTAQSSWLRVPAEFKTPPPDKCRAPKRLLHTWRGHEKGVNAIQFFPKSGHMLLSASMDHTVKIWGVGGQNRRCMRTYAGHKGAVRAVEFHPDGSTFLSASFDKYVKLWDTETGKCISRHTNQSVPYCVKFNPNDPNECLVGQNNKKIIQWDLRANEIVQEYSEHLGAISSISFFDDNRRFASTSDDKKVLVWEYGIPVVIKHVSDPEMHAMPYTAMHPDGKWLAAQSLDNRILLFSTARGFRMSHKKFFKGHHNAGYACQLGFSPDGSIICSGDGNGKAFFWDWRRGKILKSLACHDQVTIGCAWHPVHQSRVATCSWDGLIKYWD
jgi:pre-mRNA-processing factor 17